MSEETQKMQEEEEHGHHRSRFSPVFVTPGTNIEPHLSSSMDSIILGSNDMEI